MACVLQVMPSVRLAWWEKPLSLESKVKSLLLFEISIFSIRKLKPSEQSNPEGYMDKIQECA